MTQLQRSKRFGSYDDLIRYTDKPIARRRALKIGRGGRLVVPRRFHLPATEVDELRAERKRTKRMPNPHKRGFFFYLVEALVGLGVNDSHALEAVIERVRELMSERSTVRWWDGLTAWDRWVTDTPRFEKLDNDWRARFEMNVCTLQRLGGFTPYGRKLLEVGQKIMKTRGAVIDILRADDGGKLLRLNTNSNRPRNDFKVRGHGSPSELADLRQQARSATAERQTTREQQATPHG